MRHTFTHTPRKRNQTQGCFRGLQDTRTPFFATLAVNALNIGELTSLLGAAPTRRLRAVQPVIPPHPPPTGTALDYFLIFVVGLGVKGAAAATVLAQVGVG
jgi:Na+-driven multidrug efflux pump